MPTQAKKDGNARHIAKLDVIKIQPYKEEGAAIRAAAATAGKSVQGYVLEAVREKMERERAGGVPGSPAVEDRPGVVMVSAGGSPVADNSSRSISLEPSQKPAQPQVSIFKKLADLPEEERARRMGCDPESVERYRKEMERKRKRLAELNAKIGGLSRAEEAERKILLAQCRNDVPGDSPANE